MLEATSLECQRGDRRLFSGVDLRLEAGEVLHVAGENGCGKTSLLRMLCGFSPPVAGEIRWQGEPIGRLGEAYRREIFYLGHANAIKDELSPLENLLSAARLAEQTLDEVFVGVRIGVLVEGGDFFECGREAREGVGESAGERAAVGGWRGSEAGGD